MQCAGDALTDGRGQPHGLVQRQVANRRVDHCGGLDMLIVQGILNN